MKDITRYDFVHHDPIVGMLHCDNGRWVEFGAWLELSENYNKLMKEYSKTKVEQDTLTSRLKLRIQTLKDAVAALSRVLVNDNDFD